MSSIIPNMNNVNSINDVLVFKVNENNGDIDVDTYNGDLIPYSAKRMMDQSYRDPSICVMSKRFFSDIRYQLAADPDQFWHDQVLLNDMRIERRNKRHRRGIARRNLAEYAKYLGLCLMYNGWGEGLRMSIGRKILDYLDERN